MQCANPNLSLGVTSGTSAGSCLSDLPPSFISSFSPFLSLGLSLCVISPSLSVYFSLFSSLHLSNSGCLCLYVSSALSVRCLSWDLLQPGGVCGSLQQSELTGEGRSLPFVSWTCPPVEAATVHVLVLLWSPEMLL